jgi:hypothetical protein
MKDCAGAQGIEGKSTAWAASNIGTCKHCLCAAQTDFGMIARPLFGFAYKCIGVAMHLCKFK